LIPVELKALCNDFYDNNAHRFDLTELNGCGEYMLELVPFCQQNGFPKVGFLKKSSGQTNYKLISHDNFLYNEPFSSENPKLQAVDVIANAESKPPYTPSHQPPGKAFGVDEPRYTEADWLEEFEDNGGDMPGNTVPWVGYNEGSFQELKRQLAYDYARRPQGADFDVSVWSARVFHSAYMGPERIPLGLPAAIDKHTPEWCGALGVAIKKVPTGWNIGDPV